MTEVNIPQEVWLRFEQLAKHPRARFNALGMFKLCVDTKTDPKHYADALELEHALYDAVAAYKQKQGVINLHRLFFMAAGSFGAALSHFTRTEDGAIFGVEIAETLINNTLTTFSHYLWQYISIAVPPAAPKAPTHDAPNILN